MNFVEKLWKPIRVLEKQSGLSRLLFFLLLNIDCKISYMVDVTNMHTNAAYAAVRKATDLKLIISDYGEESDYSAHELVPSEKGKRVAMCSREVNDILRD